MSHATNGWFWRHQAKAEAQLLNALAPRVDLPAHAVKHRIRPQQVNTTKLKQPTPIKNRPEWTSTTNSSSIARKTVSPSKDGQNIHPVSGSPLRGGPRCSPTPHGVKASLSSLSPTGLKARRSVSPVKIEDASRTTSEVVSSVLLDLETRKHTSALAAKEQKDKLKTEAEQAQAELETLRRSFCTVKVHVVKPFRAPGN
eukprot:gnl/Hemi2/7939_TR2742_c0_g1_i1.p1 gnl/Hemi2/7939_TR2742_c0_g1~~gnl/Hemi2/7939_TR2742_c0_g1_i1.p1  ORF type:complete len:199 (+),score=21.85 gnl/Hemi2/7939_TR2742_c0_g1_i1:81-677(+)